MKKLIIVFFLGMFFSPAVLAMSAEGDFQTQTYESGVVESFDAPDDEALNEADAHISLEEEELKKQEEALAKRRAALNERRAHLKELRVKWKSLSREERAEKLGTLFVRKADRMHQKRKAHRDKKEDRAEVKEEDRSRMAEAREARFKRIQERFAKRKAERDQRKDERNDSVDDSDDLSKTTPNRAFREMLERATKKRTINRNASQRSGYSNFRKTLQRRQSQLRRTPSTSRSRIDDDSNVQGLSDRVQRGRINRYDRRANRFGRKSANRSFYQNRARNADEGRTQE